MTLTLTRTTTLTVTVDSWRRAGRDNGAAATAEAVADALEGVDEAPDRIEFTGGGAFNWCNEDGGYVLYVIDDADHWHDDDCDPDDCQCDDGRELVVGVDFAGHPDAVTWCDGMFVGNAGVPSPDPDEWAVAVEFVPDVPGFWATSPRGDAVDLGMTVEHDDYPGELDVCDVASVLEGARDWAADRDPGPGTFRLVMYLAERGDWSWPEVIDRVEFTLD